MVESLRRWALLEHPHSLWHEVRPWGEQRRRAWRFWAVAILLLFASHSLARVWVFQYAGLASADWLDRLRAAQTSVKVGVVSITAEQRNAIGHGVDPMPPDDLLRTICAVLRRRPKVLGVDLDTSRVTISTLPRSSTRIVWARGLQIFRKDIGTGREEIEVNPDYVLGMANPGVPWGLAVAPVLPDWSVRSVSVCYEIEEGRAMPTFISALARASGKEVPHCSGGPRESEVGAFRIHYKFHRFTLDPVDFPPVDKAGLERCLQGSGDWADRASNHPISQYEVVLLGGEYDSRDWHPTLFGSRPGVEVQAALLEHMLQGTAGIEIGELKEWLAKLTLALMLAWINCRFRPVAALLLCLAGLGALVLAGGAIAAVFTDYRATMVPFWLGIVLEQLVNGAERAQETSK